MAQAIIGSYQNYLNLMSQYRVNMGGKWNKDWPQSKKDNYEYWRERIKELRYYAVQEGIDLYTLEFEAHTLIRNDKINVKINELEKERKKLIEDYPKLNNEKEKLDNVTKQRELENQIYIHEQEKKEELDSDTRETFRRYVNEAYLVSEMVALRQRWDNATEPEREVMRGDAHQLRIQVVAELHGGLDDPYDWERRVFKMYKGYDISTSTDPEDIALWEGQKALMKKAIDEVNLMAKTYGKDFLGAMEPIDKVWEQKYNDDEWNSKWRTKLYETFSGADMTVHFAFPGYKPIDIGVASLLSYSIYREKKQIRTIGAINTKGITKGARTISGRMVFTVIREHIVEMIRRLLPYTRDMRTILMDELPPFDVLVSFGNEYGASAGLVIQGVTFVDEQKTLTVEDMYTENIFTYLARGIEPMREYGYRSYTDPYNPMEWYTSSFTPTGSEVLGYFKVEDLTLATMGNLITDPVPFFGTATGWDPELYESFYNEGTFVYDDAPTSIGSGGSTVGESTPTPTPTPPKADSDYGTDKISKKADYVWLANASTDGRVKDMHSYGGFRGNKSEKDYKDRFWDMYTYALIGDSYMSSYDSHKTLKDKIDTIKDNVGVRRTDDLKIKLSTYNRKHEKSSQTYKVAITWDLYLPDEYDQHTGPHKEGITQRNHIHSMMKFYERHTSFEDLQKAIWSESRKGPKASDNDYWVVDIKGKSYTNDSKKKTSIRDGKYGIVTAQIRKNFGTHVSGGKVPNAAASPEIITVNGTAKEINLKQYLWFVSASTIFGNRVLLSYDDLPSNSVVVVKFTYDAYNPNDPLKTGDRTDKRYFYILVKKPGSRSEKEHKSKNPYFKIVDFSTHSQIARWNIFNQPISKKYVKK